MDSEIRFSLMSGTPSQATAGKDITQRKFSALFLLLLAYLVLYPYAQNAGFPYLAFRVFGTFVTVLSVYAVSFRRGFVLTALVLAVPAMVQRIFLPRADAGALPLTSIVLGLTFDVFIVAVIFHRVFVKEEPTREAIFGALCVYLLAGFTFASLYGMLTTIQPRAFYLDPAVNPHSVPDRFDLIYYSFATLTCLGATGITPVSAQARSTSVIEALVGVLYLAVLISRLLTAYHTRHAMLANSEQRIA
jgi:Ion channel